jgi:hypothetical protein
MHDCSFVEELKTKTKKDRTKYVFGKVSGEVIPRRTCTQKNWERFFLEKSFSRRNRTRQYWGTSSPGEFVPTKCWVQLLLRKNFVSFGYDISRLLEKSYLGYRVENN